VLKATTFLATLNAIHPFRDGNGRTQLAFMALLAARAGHSLLLDRLHARRFLNAVKSFHGDQRPLQIELRKLVD
jgi:cell filamentation protein